MAPPACWAGAAYPRVMRASKPLARWMNCPPRSGWACASVQDERCRPLLLQSQRDLYHLMAEVASSPENAGQFHFEAGRIEWLEQQIEVLGKTVEMPGEFILPGDSAGGAALSMARAVVRRAERRLVELFDAEETANPALHQYLNRLSSLLFVLELIENQAAGKETTIAKGQD